MNSLFSYFKKFFFKLEYGRDKEISSFEDLISFISKEASYLTSNALFKYAAKRLGKIHYKMTFEVSEYNRHLMEIQAKTHKRILCDITCLYLQTLDINESLIPDFLITKVKGIHQEFIEEFQNQLGLVNDIDQDMILTSLHLSLKDISTNTGNYFFEIFPMTDSLHKSNKSIIVNNLRFEYINSQRRFNDICKKEKLSWAFGALNTN